MKFQQPHTQCNLNPTSTFFAMAIQHATKKFS